MYCVLHLLLQGTGSKPLHLAALKDNMDVMRILITECGCKADLGDAVHIHDSDIYKFACFNNIRTLYLLLFRKDDLFYTILLLRVTSVP